MLMTDLLLVPAHLLPLVLSLQHAADGRSPVDPSTLSGLCPVPQDFQYPSLIHGQRHVARVMVHAFRLLQATGLREHTGALWAAVYLHDLARNNDGVCHRHGADAWTRFEQEPGLREALAPAGLGEDQWRGVKTAVTWHCKWRELPDADPHLVLARLLKDADGLDRVRIRDLDLSYLRFRQTTRMEGFSWALHDYSLTVPEGPELFGRLWAWTLARALRA